MLIVFSAFIKVERSGLGVSFSIIFRFLIIQPWIRNIYKIFETVLKERNQLINQTKQLSLFQQSFNILLHLNYLLTKKHQYSSNYHSSQNRTFILYDHLRWGLLVQFERLNNHNENVFILVSIQRFKKLLIVNEWIIIVRQTGVREITGYLCFH